MRYHNITYDDMLNGEGLRVVLWVSGCEHACPECHNPQTWRASSGIPFTEWDEAEFWQYVALSHIEGVTFSGGDPLHPENRDTIGRLAKAVKHLYPDKNIWLYTGYSMSFSDDGITFYDEVRGLKPFQLDWLEYIDVLVDGRFDASIRATDIRNGELPLWRGSSNQRLILVKESIASHSIVLKD